MLFFDGAFGFLMLGVWIFCLIDVITTDAALCRNLPKMAWVFLVLLLPDIGSIVWLVAGRTWPSTARAGLPYKGNTGAFPEYDRPGRARATNPDDDDAFLRSLREKTDRERRERRQREQTDPDATA